MMITLCSDKTNISVSTDKISVEQACKRVLQWRTAKNYASIYDRFMSASSSDYDKVIKFLGA